MIRALVLVLLLLAGPAWANSYDTLVAAYGATNYYPFTTDATTDTIGGANATCYGTCTAAQPLATNVSGATFSGTGPCQGNASIPYPCTSSNIYATPSAGDFSTVFWVKTTQTSGSSFLTSFEGGLTAFTYIGYSQGVPGSGAYCTSTQVFDWFGSNDRGGGTTTGLVCGSKTINDGAAHMVSNSCVNGGTNVANCTLYIDGVFQQTSTVNFGYAFGPVGRFAISATTGITGGVAQFNGTALSGAQTLALYCAGIGGCGGGPINRAFGQVIQ